MKTLLAAGSALLLAAGPVMAGDLGDWSVAPYTADLGAGIDLSVHGSANGSAFTADQPDSPGLQTSGATGSASLAIGLKRDYDSGMRVALNTVFEVYHDKFSGDNYGSDFVQKVYGSVQTGLGRIEIGQQDGAAYALAVTGPVVESDISIDNTNATFFRDPSTGAAFINVFQLNSAVESSLNYAKVSYYSPRLFGVEIAASFTPSEGKDVVPFLSNGPHVADKQQNIWEGALSYTNDFGPLSLQFYGGLSLGHDAAKTFGHAGLTDWGVGSELDYTIDDDTQLAVGGAFRQSNSYAFNINNVLASGSTTSAHLSTTLKRDSWILGFEYGDGAADGRLGAPSIGMRGYEAAIGYVLNTNMQLNAGWERFDYTRSAGTFYNGAPRIGMDAAFVHLQFNI